MENNEITTLLQSPTFWFATVFVSLLVSMLGSFLYNLAQKMWAFFSKKQADKNKAKQKAFENLVMEAHKKGIHTSELEIHSIYTNLWNMLFLIVLLIVALFINSISNGSFPFLVTGLIVWALLIVVANRSIDAASYDRKFIDAVRKLNSETTQKQFDEE